MAEAFMMQVTAKNGKTRQEEIIANSSDHACNLAKERIEDGETATVYQRVETFLGKVSLTEATAALREERFPSHREI